MRPAQLGNTVRSVEARRDLDTDAAPAAARRQVEAASQTDVGKVRGTGRIVRPLQPAVCVDGGDRFEGREAATLEKLLEPKRPGTVIA